MICFQIEAAFHFHQSCDPLTVTSWCSSLHSKSDIINSRNIWNPGMQHHPFIEKSSTRNFSSQPRSNHMLCMTTNKNKEDITDEKESKKGSSDWFSRISSKKENKKKPKGKRTNEDDDNEQKKNRSDGNGSWISRVSRKVFSKSPEEEQKKKRDLFLKGKLGQASTLSNREDLIEENEDKQVIWPTLEKETQVKQELKRKELLAKSAMQKEEAQNRYKKQMQILQRNKVIAEAASSSDNKKNKDSNFFKPLLFPSQNTTKIKTSATKGKKLDNQDKNATKLTMLGGVTTNVANFASNIWENTITKATTSVSSKSKKRKEEWITVCPKTRISPNQIVPVVAAGLDLLLVASKDGKRVYGIANSCPHLGTPLDLGTLERRDKEITPPSLMDKKMKDSKSKLKNNSTSIDNNNMFFNTQNTRDNDGCEDCIVCPLHRTAFALQNGEVRGEWCPYPPVVGKLMGTVKTKSNLVTFELRVKGKNIEVRISSDIDDDNNEGNNNSEKKNFLDIF